MSKLSEAMGTRDESDGPLDEQETFERFFEARYELLLRALFLVTGSLDEAEDATQEAFVRAYERWGQVSRGTNPAGYVYRTALNIHRSRLRRIRVEVRRWFASPSPDALAASDDRDELRRALARLPRGQREALVMIEWLGMTDDETAEALGVAPVTVRVRASRARSALNRVLSEGGLDD
jgi:RNA polymerase sigma-70 factor (ECF subfamily)